VSVLRWCPGCNREVDLAALKDCHPHGTPGCAVEGRDLACCARCRFFQASEPRGGKGTCRRHAPQLALSGRALGSVGSLDTKTEWPTVGASDWCGDHEARR
jgi:hypothetical protein